MTTHFLIVTQHAWMNESGTGVEYRWDGREFAHRETAIHWATNAFRHDDFNIATIIDGRLVAFGWGMDDFGPDTDGAPHGGHNLAEIAGQVGLTEAAIR